MSATVNAVTISRGCENWSQRPVAASCTSTRPGAEASMPTIIQTAQQDQERVRLELGLVTAAMTRRASLASSSIFQSNMPTRIKSAPLLSGGGKGGRGGMAPAARILKAIHGFLTFAMKSITACGSLHQELSFAPTASFSPGRGAVKYSWE